MSTKGMLTHSVDKLLRSLCPPEAVNAAERGQWPAELWTALEGAGLTRAWLAEDAGGSGVGAGDVLAMLRTAGRFAAPVPLAETLLAGWLLESAGLRIPDGPLTVAPVTAGDRIDFRKAGSSWRLSGSARHVPWASQLRHLVVIGQAEDSWQVAVVEASRCRISPGKNLAGESRDSVDFDAVTIGSPDAASAPPGITQGALLQRGALSRVALMTGAVEKVMELSLRYANDRVQFGKPIGKFQSVQQQLAVMAGEVAAAASRRKRPARGSDLARQPAPRFGWARQLAWWRPWATRSMRPSESPTSTLSITARAGSGAGAKSSVQKRIGQAIWDTGSHNSARMACGRP